MYYALDPRYRLCGYRDVPNLLYHTRVREFTGISARDMEILKNCSGTEDRQPDADLERLCALRVLRRSPVPIPDSGEQKYTFYDNRYFRSVEWAITAGCNLNCRHCFVARDEGRNTERFSLEQARETVRQLAACGVREVHLTGGEPLTHPDLTGILKLISDAGLTLVRIVTNGLLIEEALFDTLRELGQDPEFTVSFDGLGRHEWLRNATGIEQKTLDRIRSVKEAGFDVSVQMCLHRGNVDSVWDTVRYFEALGIAHMRLMRASEAPRWEKYTDMTLTPEEYFDFSYDFIRRYIQADGKMPVCIWQFLWFYPGPSATAIRSVARESLNRNGTVCSDARENFFIGASGEISQCIPVSGALLARGVSMGNVKKEPLQKLLSDSPLTRLTLKPLSRFFEENGKCGSCRYRDVCGGGCRALAYGLTGDFNGHDPMRCVYFFGGYYDKINALREEYGRARSNGR